MKNTHPEPVSPALLQHRSERSKRRENRVADQITRFAGSMKFVYIHAIWFGLWIALGVEDYPFGLLTMIVSLEAIFLSTFVMISQNRADEKRQVIADEAWRTVQEEEQQNERLLRLSNQILDLTKEIHAARASATPAPVPELTEATAKGKGTGKSDNEQSTASGSRLSTLMSRGWRPVEPPRRPVLFVNPRSGDGAATRNGVVERARERGVETVILGPGDDLTGTRPGGRGRRGRCARNGGRRRVPRGGCGSRGGAGAAFRLHPRRHAQPLRARPRCGPAGRARRSGRVHRWSRAPDRHGRSERPHLPEQRLPRNLRRGSPAGQLPRYEGPNPGGDGAEGTRSQWARIRLCALSTTPDESTHGLRCCWSPTTLMRWTVPVSAPDRRSPAASWESWSRHHRGEVRHTLRGEPGAPLTWKSKPRLRCMPASTARQSSSSAPLTFDVRPAALRVRICARHPGASPAARIPRPGLTARRCTVIALDRAIVNRASRHPPGLLNRLGPAQLRPWPPLRRQRWRRPPHHPGSAHPCALASRRQPPASRRSGTASWGTCRPTA